MAAASSPAAHAPLRWVPPSLAVYALALTATLVWPGLTVPAVVPRPDLIAHGVSFGLLSLLLALWNPHRWPALGAAAGSAVAGVAYGAATELIQRISWLNRSGSWDDFWADCFGVACGVVAYSAWAAVRHNPATPSSR